MTKILNCICLFDDATEKKLQVKKEEISALCDSMKALEQPPHLSLRADFEVEEEDLPKMESELRVLFENTPVLEVRLTKYGFYSWRVIYLDVDKSPELVRLHEEVMRITQKYRTIWMTPEMLANKSLTEKQQEYVTKYGYHLAFEYYSPHVTLAGNDMSEEVFGRGKERLSKIDENITAKVTRIAMLDRNEGNRIALSFELRH